MNLEYNYWSFKGVLSSRLCRDIITYGLQHTSSTALTGGHIRDPIKDPLSKQELKTLQKLRYSNISWLDDPWIYNEIQPYINVANKNAGWNFQWDWSESIQFTHYQLNYHYNWHRDSLPKPYDDSLQKNFAGKIRKLSVTVSLSAPDDYEGGNLEFNFFHNVKSKPQVCKEVKPQGSIVVFPSHVYHRVTPVTKGKRYSLVLWQLGNPFK